MRAAALALWAILSLSLISGCASAPPAAAAGASTTAATAPPMGLNPADPWEAFNRKMFAFNDAIDGALLKPIAESYRDVVPELVRTGVSNVLSNVGDVWSAVNHLLQGKVEHGLNMGMRVLANTFFGLGGLLDPASEMGLIRRSEDFGQTLGVWGFGPGPYVVLPVFGPRTVRDSFGLAVDFNFEPSKLPHSTEQQYLVSALGLLTTRVNLLATTNLLSQVALDRYSFVRDAYLSRRLDAVYDGNPPMEKMEDDGADEPAKPGEKAGEKPVPTKK